MQYVSTRNKDERVSAAQAIVKGLAADGGLYVPEFIPVISAEEFSVMRDYDYAERAATVLAKYLDGFSYSELLEYTQAAYGKFDGDPCPLVNVDENTFFMELWHGPTCAFKDMALTLLPYLMVASRKKIGDTAKTLILVATSGDTGKAALEGFKDVENTDIIVFYPSNGVSDIQKLQMMTQSGNNVYVCAIDGNFDDAQTSVKEIFASENLRKYFAERGYELSSANSINWGRLAPQIAYYVSAYLDLLNAEQIFEGDSFNVCVPTGNFGNILAAYYAKKMGVPIDKLICASNSNKILTDFFETGEYNTDREFLQTISPSMDILVSSNFERLLYELSGGNSALISEKMLQLKNNGRYAIDLSSLSEDVECFSAGYAGEEDTRESIDNYLEVYDYLIDPHTAVGACVYANYIIESGDDKATVIVSTANPYKFAGDVYYAVAKGVSDDPFKSLDKLLSYTGEPIPEQLSALKWSTVRFDECIDKEDVADKIKEYLAGKA